MRLTKHQAAQMRSLMADSGYSRKEARALALEGFGELTKQDLEDLERAKAEDAYEAEQDAMTDEPQRRGKWGSEEP